MFLHEKPKEYDKSVEKIKSAYKEKRIGKDRMIDDLIENVLALKQAATEKNMTHLQVVNEFSLLQKKHSEVLKKEEKLRTIIKALVELV